jgi:hypothetical protein
LGKSKTKMVKDKLELFKERRRLFDRIHEIDKLLKTNSDTNKLTIEEIALKVKEFTGVEVKDIGKRCKKNGKIAKQIFWRAGFLNFISGTKLSNYTGDKSRLAAITGRSLHINKCETDGMLLVEWNDFKKFLKK